MNTFRQLHQEEANRAITPYSQSKSSKNVASAFKVNLVRAETPENSISPKNKINSSNKVMFKSINSRMRGSVNQSIDSNNSKLSQFGAGLERSKLVHQGAWFNNKWNIARKKSTQKLAEPVSNLLQFSQRGSAYDIQGSNIETIEERSVSVSSASFKDLNKTPGGEESQVNKKSLDSPVVKMKTVKRDTFGFEKKQTNPKTMKSHNSTLSKKTKDTKAVNMSLKVDIH